MIIVEIIGGLGNQMFQYAIGKALSYKLNCEFKMDITTFDLYKLHKYNLDSFNIVENYASIKEIEKLKYEKKSLFDKLFKINSKVNNSYIEEKHFHFDEQILNLSGDLYLKGYWQSEKYFNSVSNLLKEDFTLKNSPIGKNKEMLNIIHSKNSISLHIRRGDYVSDNTTNSIHGTCDLAYYVNSIKYITQRIENPHLFLFSDDIDWVIKNFKLELPFTIVDINNKDTGYEDIRLMSACKHHIIANSTFSWWGAWLGHNPQKIIIAPKKWFKTTQFNTKDLIPENWIKL